MPASTPLDDLLGLTEDLKHITDQLILSHKPELAMLCNIAYAVLMCGIAKQQGLPPPSQASLVENFQQRLVERLNSPTD